MYLFKSPPRALLLFSQYVVYSLSSDRFFCNSMDYIAPPGSSVHGIPRQEYWSGLPFPTPGDLPEPGIKHVNMHWQVDPLPLSLQRSPNSIVLDIY